MGILAWKSRASRGTSGKRRRLVTSQPVPRWRLGRRLHQDGLTSELYRPSQGIGGFLVFQTLTVVSRSWVTAMFDDA